MCEQGRAEILKKTSRGMPLAPDVDFDKLALATPDFTGHKVPLFFPLFGHVFS